MAEENRSILEEQNRYNQLIEQFKAAEAVELSKRDEHQLKMMAMTALTQARLLRKTIQALMAEAQSEGNAKLVAQLRAKVDKIEQQIVKWEARCKVYGSSLSAKPKTTFADIAGLDDIKRSILDYLYVIQHPDIARDYSISTNLGILLYGPPGTGKTMFGEAIANELGLRYFVITPSDIFGAYVGESEKNIKELFEELRACTDGSVLLIDECETIFAKRTSEANRASLGVTNQLLQEMNGQGDIASSKRVIVGATNRPEMIDEAYLRYKRFSLQCYVGLPNRDAKKCVIDLKLGKMRNAYTEDFYQGILYYANTHEYVTCADLSGIIEQCAFRAVTDMRSGSGVRVLINRNHLDAVTATYQLSVTPEMLAEYERFRNRSRS